MSVSSPLLLGLVLGLMLAAGLGLALSLLRQAGSRRDDPAIRARLRQAQGLCYVCDPSGQRFRRAGEANRTGLG